MNITIAQMVISYIMSSPYLRHVKCPTSVDDDHRPLKVKTLNTQFVPENHWENSDETWWPRQRIYHHLSCTFPASGPKFAGTITDYTNIQVMCAPACLKKVPLNQMVYWFSPLSSYSILKLLFWVLYPIFGHTPTLDHTSHAIPLPFNLPWISHQYPIQDGWKNIKPTLNYDSSQMLHV